MIMSLIYDMQQLFGVRQFKTPQTILVSPLRMPRVLIIVIKLYRHTHESHKPTKRHYSTDVHIKAQI